MRSKHTQQAEDRVRHRAKLAEAKLKRRQAPSLARKAPSKSERPFLLIVCEGKNTEPSYFRLFKLTNASIKAIGTGANTVSLVQRAAELAQMDHYDQVWCVYDKDSFSANDFNNGIKMADSLGFQVAWSNQAFEYWLILHFEDHQGGAMHRDLYHGKINGYLNPMGVRYDGHGSKIVSREIFMVLNAEDPKTGKLRVDLAIDRAKRNLSLHDRYPSAQAESSTTVHLLVAELKKYF